MNVLMLGLEPGLRMLHTLEQQEAACLSLNRLEGESDDSNNVGESPQNDSTSSTLTTISKNGNKKRKKKN